MDYPEINVKIEHFESICRLCLKHDSLFLKPIFPDEDCKEDFALDEETHNETISKMIEKYTKIEISQMDILPKYICSECFDQLCKCSNFCRQCIQNDKILKNIVGNYKSKEISDSGDNCIPRETKSKSESFIKTEIFVEDEEDKDSSMGLDQGNSTEQSVNGKESKDSDQDIPKVRLEKNRKQRERYYRNKATGIAIKKELRRDQCQICGLLVTQIKAHMLSHTGERNYKCTFCEKAFKAKGEQMRHMSIHLNRREFECDICAKAFNTSKALKLHSDTHSDEKKFSCDVCNQHFSSKNSLRVHRRIHFDDRRYECTTCHKWFYTKSCVTKHKRTHTGEKPYKCEYCPKSYGNSSNFVKHKKTHTNGAPHKCVICESNFVYRADLNEHLKSHKNDKAKAVNDKRSDTKSVLS